jgi:hypothetical protein
MASVLIYGENEDDDVAKLVEEKGVPRQVFNM